MHAVHQEGPAVASALLPWLDQAKVRLFSAGPSQSGRLDGNLHQGEQLTIVELHAQGIGRVLFRNQNDVITLAIAGQGQAKGTAGGRPYRSIPNRYCFLLLPDEVLEVSVGSAALDGIVLQVQSEYLLAECQIHGLEGPDLVSLNETIPGHEQLLLACARQLLELARSDEAAASARMIAPLEASILSLLASLVGSSQSENSRYFDDAEQPRSVYVQKALGFFEDNMAEILTLTDICRACNVSARTLQVSFQSVMNRTPLQVLQELRMKRLRELLLHRVPVSAACQRVGLQPSGRMSGVYKKMFGELPSQTRKNALN